MIKDVTSDFAPHEYLMKPFLGIEPLLINHNDFFCFRSIECIGTDYNEMVVATIMFPCTIKLTRAEIAS